MLDVDQNVMEENKASKENWWRGGIMIVNIREVYREKRTLFRDLMKIEGRSRATWNPGK